MATIKEGFNSKPLQIKLGNPRERSAELWLIQNGLPSSVEKYRETLSYISLDELLTLRDEINLIIKEITGI
jgi:hypothetical protein